MIAKNKKIKKKSRFKNIFFSILIGIFLIVIAGFLFFSNLEIKQKRAEMAEEIEALEKDIRLLTERNQQLKEGIFQTESDAYWQGKLYEQGYKKPGEEVVVIVPPTEEKKETQAAERKNLLENIKEFFGF